MVRLHRNTNTNTNTHLRGTITMKKTIAITAAALVSVLALSACGPTDSTATPSDTPTAVAPLDREAPSLTDSTRLTQGEQEFVAAIEEYDAIDYPAVEEDGIAAYGNLVCSDLSDGIDPLAEAAFISDELGVTAFEGGFVVGLAANSICPEFSDLVDEAANAALDGEYDSQYA